MVICQHRNLRVAQFCFCFCCATLLWGGGGGVTAVRLWLDSDWTAVGELQYLDCSYSPHHQDQSWSTVGELQYLDCSHSPHSVPPVAYRSYNLLILSSTSGQPVFCTECLRGTEISVFRAKVTALQSLHILGWGV